MIGHGQHATATVISTLKRIKYTAGAPLVVHLTTFPQNRPGVHVVFSSQTPEIKTHAL